MTPGLVGLTMSGGSQVDADGALDEVDLEVSGGSTASLERLVVSNLVVQISGGSSARVNASDAIEGDVASGASLAIEGDPEVDNVLGAVGADLDN